HSSITPDRELAYLALVSSRDEEQAEAAKPAPATEAMNDDAKAPLHATPEPERMDVDATSLSNKKPEGAEQKSGSEVSDSETIVVKSYDRKSKHLEARPARAQVVDEDYAMLDDAASDATLMGDTPPSWNGEPVLVDKPKHEPASRFSSESPPPLIGADD